MRMCYDYNDEVVLVKIGSPEQEPHMVHEKACDRVYEFNKWCSECKIYSIRMMMSGAGRFEGIFRKKDWPKIKRWLDFHDFDYGPTTRQEAED